MIAGGGAPLLLRAPPFPWVDQAVAAVSMPGRSHLQEPDRLFAAMRDSGVGGAFWRNDLAGDDAHEDAVLRWISGAPGEPDRRAEAIAVIESATYRNPFTNAACDAHEAVRILADWAETLWANRRIIGAVGMSGWKREAIGRFLWDGQRAPPFLTADQALKTVRPGDAIAYWPSRAPAEFGDQVSARGGIAWQVEDGFIRSAGLGAECRPPWSIIADRLGGIHYDPRQESEVERLLATHDFDAPLLARAAALRAQIVDARLCKYGVDEGAMDADLPVGKRIVLVIGQVADDLSVVRSGDGGMDDLLRRVRACEPDAFIVYRPHPDVIAGLRNGTVPGAGEADLISAGGSLLALLERVDAVHVLSSLTGFEALLRGVPVTVHGAPFYAGWGLTRDLGPVPPRRGRHLSLDALVAAALILAPRYCDPETGLPCPPEVLVERLAKSGKPTYNAVTGFRRAYGAARAAGRLMTRGRR